MNKTWKRIGLLLAALVSLLILAFGGVSMAADTRLSRRFDVHDSALPLPSESDTAAISRGSHLAARYGCTGCHGADLGGGVMIDDPAIGHVPSPNLTRAGRVASYSMADWDRIVRHGVFPDGTAALMPSDDFFKMSDQELLDIVAYARSVEPVPTQVPARRLGPVGKVLVVLGKLPLSAEAQGAAVDRHAVTPPQTADTVEFGAHLAATCVGCHRASFEGGPMLFGPPDWPAAGNLTPHEDGLGQWSYDDFERALSQGIGKDGRRLRAPMSEVVGSTKAMLPTERQALWTYLRSLPAKPAQAR